MADESQSSYDIVIADLEGKRDQLTATIEMLRALRSGGTIALPLPVVAMRSQGTQTDIPRDAFFGMTLPEAARKYLAMGTVTKSNPELCEALLKGGFKTQSNNFSEVVRSTLGRHPDFRKVNGEWGLAEWYGNRGAARRSRRTLLEQVQDNEKDGDSEGPSEVSSDGPS